MTVRVSAGALIDGSLLGPAPRAYLTILTHDHGPEGGAVSVRHPHRAAHDGLGPVWPAGPRDGRPDVRPLLITDFDEAAAQNSSGYVPGSALTGQELALTSAGRDRGLDEAAEAHKLLFTSGRADELQGRGKPGRAAGHGQG